MSKTPDVVFDTQVFLRALINPKSVCGRLVFDWQPDYGLHTTEKINFEVLDVLNRPSIRAKFPQITDALVKLITLVLGLASQVEIKPEDIEPICRDPKDDIFLACAKAANADYLVTEDNDLLVLQQHHATQIVNVAAFLSVLEQRKNAESSQPDE